jgi:hypothetical protein
MQERWIKITAGGVAATAALNDGATADLLWDALPIEASGDTWGDEIMPASAVNVVGKINDDATVLKSVGSGATAVVERA